MASKHAPVGIGLVGSQFISNIHAEALRAVPNARVHAVMSPTSDHAQSFAQRHGIARAFTDLDAMLAVEEIDVIVIGAPNVTHCDITVRAADAGKHVIVEKPMAVSLEEADRMVDVAAKEGVVLLAGHTRSLSLWNRAMRRIVLSGAIGRVRAIHISAYTDWMIRPRTPDELDPNQGGGIVYRQGPHQIDTVRLLGGGMLRSVRGTTGQWFDARPVPGYFTAYMEFEDGTAATVMHNGYGYFVMGSQYAWVDDKRQYSDADRAGLRRALTDKSRDELKEKAEYRVGGPRDPRADAVPVPYPWKPFDLGPVELICERGIIRPAQWGLTVHSDDGRRDVDLRDLQRTEADPSGGLTHSIIGELHDALALGKPAYHTGAWGRATLEAILALIRSARERREIVLERQVPMPDSYDAALAGPIAEKLSA